MKNLRYITIFLLITILSCSKKTKQTENKIQKINNSTLDFEKVKILEKLYVNARNGLNYRKKPNGIILGKLPYGEKVEIIEYTGIKDEIADENRIIKGEWLGIKNYNDEKTNKVYVFSSFLDIGSNIKLIKKNLSIVQGIYSPKSEVFFYESGKEMFVDSLLKFEIISKDIFNQLKKKNIDYINRDSTNVHRNKDTLFIKHHKFIDNNIDNESRINFKYIGSIDFLNKYVILRNLWENEDFILVDKSTGKIDSENEKLLQLARKNGMNLLGFPRISINKKNMISLKNSSFTQQAELNIFKIIKNSELQLELSLLFKTWSPSENEIFWISDNEFIVKAFPIDVISEYEYGEQIDSENYLKIKIFNL